MSDPRAASSPDHGVDLLVMATGTPAGLAIRSPLRQYAGKRATFFSTSTPDSYESGYAYKQYNRTGRGRAAEIRHRLTSLSEVIAIADDDFQISRFIPALPINAVERTDGNGYGVLVRRMEQSDGQPFSTIEDTVVLADHPLESRVRMAFHLASQVFLLHQAGILHSDMTPGHILLTPHQDYALHVQLVSLDHSAILEMDNLKRYWKGVGPVVEPRRVYGGVFAAPEIVMKPGGAPKMATIESELWSLAANIHYLLTLNPGPFRGHGPSYKEIIQGAFRWPPEKTTPQYSAILAELGTGIYRTFRRVFDRQGAVDFNPMLRPTAFEWMKILEGRLAIA